MCEYVSSSFKFEMNESSREMTGRGFQKSELECEV